MKLVLISLLASFALLGCVTTVGKHSTPTDLTGITSGLNGIQGHVEKAKASVKTAQQSIVEIEKSHPDFQPVLMTLDSPLKDAQIQLEQISSENVALKLLASQKQNEVDKQVAISNRISDHDAAMTLQNATLKLHNLYHWIALGSLAALMAGFFVLRQYFPFLKAI